MKSSLACAVLFAFGTVAVACGGSESAPPAPPEPGPAPSAPPGRPGTTPPPPPGMTAPPPAGGSSGTPAPEPPPGTPPSGGAGSGAGGAGGGSGTGGAGGGSGATGGAGGSATDGPGQATPDAVSPAPADAAAPAAACTSDPGPAATTLRLAFKPIALSGMPAQVGTGKSPGGLTELRFVPGSPNEFFISQKGGRLNHLRLEGDRATVITSYFIPGVFAQDDCGLVSFAYDPGFAQNRIIYAAYCTASTRSKVARFTLGPDGLTNAADVITFSEPQGTQPWHSVGSLGFEPDGTMWLLHGEFTDASNAQDPASNLGKLLRLRPRRDQPGFDPAPGNAFTGQPGRSPLVYAMGFRSPWRGYRDSKGRFLIGDVGNTSNEELNLVTQAGQNFGWNGSRSGPCSGAGCGGLTNPLTTYRNGSDPYEGEDPAAQGFESRAGRAIWVGVQYQDCGNDRYSGAMTGVYLFGDWYTGWVRGTVIDEAGARKEDRMLAILPGLSAWEQGPDGYLYAARFGAYGTGGHANEQIGLFRVQPAGP
jgi:hypothetical protein